MGRSIELLDTTLRDGAQAEGISLSVEDKFQIIEALRAVGVALIEAGNPMSNPKDMEFFQALPDRLPSLDGIVAFCATRHKNRAAGEDSGLRETLRAGTPVVAMFGKCWDLHVTDVLGALLEDNLRMIEESCAYLKQAGKRVIFDAEHFFDGYLHNEAYALRALEAAARGGADTLALCDTNGGTLPDDVGRIVAAVVKAFASVKIGIHCHNDADCAVAGSIAAVQAGASHVQGTFLGLGERCGNANLVSILAGLQLKRGYACLSEDRLPLLTETARRIAEVANTSLKRFTPYVGSSAFAHKAGMHADGVLKCAGSFEHIDPHAVGNERRILMSEIAGRTAVLKKIQNIAPGLERTSPELDGILTELKRLEYEGYQFEGADGSFEMLVRRQLGLFKRSFSLVSYKVLDELPYDNRSATATIKVRVDGRLQISAAEGDGPINALDRALREALSTFYPELSRVRLTDYKVRVIDSGKASAAKIRVLITSSDGQSDWSTVGVSKDVIEASWFALVDSIEYKLKDRR